MTEVRKRRASGAPGVRFAASPVDRDDTGSWLLVEAGTAHVHDDGWVQFLSPNPVLLVIPDTGFWVASTSRTGAKVDLCSQVLSDDDHAEFVDVELDVVWRWGEPPRIDDVDEFHALGLTDGEAGAYLAEADRILALVGAGASPYGPAFRQRLVDLTAPPDAWLAATWAGAVGPNLAAAVSELIGPSGCRSRVRASAGCSAEEGQTCRRLSGSTPPMTQPL